MTDLALEGVEQLPLREFTEQAYLNYFNVRHYGSRIATYW